MIDQGTPEQQKSAKDTLYILLDNTLKMIHPFMPFISEEMWQRLPKRSTEKSPETIVKASYPVYREEYFNEKALSDYDLILESVKTSRSILAQFGILKEGKVIVESEAHYDLFVDQKDSIVSLIKAIKEVDVVKSASEVPEGCVLGSVTPETNVHVLVKGQVDLDAEIAKVHKKLEKATHFKKNLEKAVSVKDYEVKVKQEVQEQNKTKLENYAAEIEGYEATIANLKKLQI